MVSRRRSAGSRGGFTLIEILVAVSLMAILAGAMAPMALRNIRAGKIRATQERMDEVLYALVGDPANGQFGYVGEMGGVPGDLTDLNDPTGLPGYAIDANDGVGYGWNGPYAPRIAAPATPVVDAWNRAFQYDGVNAQLTSAGPDRAFGTPDDITSPMNAIPTTGDLVVTVMGIPNTGDPAEQLDATRADVFVGFSNNGTRNELAVPGAGPFSATGLHGGLHGIRVEGTGTYAAAADVRDVVTIRRGTTRHVVVLVQP